MCIRCSTKEPHFTALRSWAKYEGQVSETIKRLKYGRDISLGLVLAEFLVELLQREGWQIDLVIPVPLGVARLRERGYNQAALIAKPLALKAGLPYETHALTRVRETRSQVGLSFDQRIDNVKNAFLATRDFVNENRILIIDDVATSSATMDACGAALQIAGAVDVYGLTLARAI
jgi:ComF family protein